MAEKLVQRSEFLGTQVITRDTGRSLGVVSELWVDVDRRQVVALGLRANLVTRYLPGITQYMLLDRICQVGDVILVEDEDVIGDVNTEAFSRLVNSEVITETGEVLGRVRGFKFDPESGEVSALVIASIGIPLVPEQVLSTYELPVEEIVSNGPERIIVFEGSEERLVQLNVGLLERLGLTSPPWENEEDAYLTPKAPVENQLGSGSPMQSTPVNLNARPLQQVTPREVWEEDDWGEPEPRVIRQSQRAQAMSYETDLDEESNWGNEPSRVAPSPSPSPAESRYEQQAFLENLDDDFWEDQEPEAPPLPKINLPKKIKAPEYEEERG
jgi:sporulation protein YlmC with PRC-barrel domain